ncbi:MAG: HEPN domain-containing protein [Dehalococcoidia bacterium]|nr:HEPN domain-containing protein [Dehalococcoidia bacterium]
MPMTDNRAYDQPSLWLERAHTDATAAQVLAETDHKLDALFHVQQAMEKATKGLRLATGTTHEEVTRTSHDTLDSLLRVFREPLEAGNLLEAFLDLFNPEILERLVFAHQGSISSNRKWSKKQRRQVYSEYTRIAHFFRAPEVDKSEADNFRASVATYPPEIIELLIDTLRRIRETILGATKEPIKIAPLPPGEDWFQWLCSQVIRQVSKRISNMKPRMLKKAEVGLVKAVLGPVDEPGLRAAMASRRLWRVSRQFEWVMAYLCLYIVGTISWPHAVSARYPGRPAPAEEAIDAATAGRMGIQHYSDRIGAMELVGTLADEAEWATRILKRSLRWRA